MIDESARSSFIFGCSSFGAVLALDATNCLNGKIKKQILYEPPFIIDNGRPLVQRALTSQIEDLVSTNRRGDAIRLFFSEAMNIPAFGVLMMRLMPGWKKLADMTHTMVNDLALLAAIQDGQLLLATRWRAITVPTLVLTGEKSEAFSNVLPNTRHQILKSQHLSAGTTRSSNGRKVP